MTSPLERLAGPGKSLVAEPADADEFARLKHSGVIRLKDAGQAANSLGGRFDLAYNAAHALCLAALRYHGFRASNRYIVFQVLPHTLGLGPEVWRVMAKCHEIRNRGEYEGDLDVDERISDLTISRLPALSSGAQRGRRKPEVACGFHNGVGGQLPQIALGKFSFGHQPPSLLTRWILAWVHALANRLCTWISRCRDGRQLLRDGPAAVGERQHHLALAAMRSATIVSRQRARHHAPPPHARRSSVARTAWESPQSPLPRSATSNPDCAA